MSKHNSSQLGVRTCSILLAAFVILVLLVGGCGTATPKVYRVAILSVSSVFAKITDGFKAKMTELGYVEGKNVVYDTLEAAAQAELPGLAQKLIAAKADLIFAYPMEAAVAAKTATQGKNIPVIFAYAQIEGSDLVKSVREPGGNLTGVRYPGPEMISRRVELMLQMAPKVKRVWIGYDKNGPNTAATLEALRPTAVRAGVTLVEVPATAMGELGADLTARAKAGDIGLDAIVGMPDSFNTSADGFAVLSKFAAEHKVPIAGGVASMVQQGALFVNSTDLANVGALAAPLADKVLKGTPAGTIPVVSPEQTLVINIAVAQQLGLTVPEGLLKMANQVVK